MKMKEVSAVALMGAALTVGALGCQKPAMPRQEAPMENPSMNGTLAPAATGQTQVPSVPVQASKP